MTADQAAQMLARMMEDRDVPFGVRANIAQDLLDRAGLVAAQVHQIIPMTEDPVMRFFEGLSDPGNWESNTQPDPKPAIESYATSRRSRHDAEPEEIFEAEVVEPTGDTPPRIAEMIKTGAFDASRGSDQQGARSPMPNLNPQDARTYNPRRRCGSTTRKPTSCGSS